MVAGRYRLLDQLGRGAMGIVWRGRDDLLDRDVAIKQIVLAPMASATQAQASYQRTIREARTAARLSHPGVVTVFDVVEEDGMPWIVMELIRARPLDQVIAEDGPLPPAQAAQLGLGLLDALTAAHAAGVLHRDVKPSNVLISPDGKAFLTDFGIATMAGDPGMTQAGMVVGTPGFSSPERVRGADATSASDLWSLGATLYAAVEGRGPFDRAGGSVAIVASIATEPAPRAPSAGPLAPVIDALLRAEAAKRPDAADTARMLSQALALSQEHPRAARPAAALDQAGLDATTATQVVTVPGGDADGGGGGGSANLAAADLAGLGQPDPAGAPQPGSGRAGSRSGSAALAVGISPADSVAAADVVPDLTATPGFAGRFPPPGQGRAPAVQAQPGGHRAGRRIGRRGRSRLPGVPQRRQLPPVPARRRQRARLDLERPVGRSGQARRRWPPGQRGTRPARDARVADGGQAIGDALVVRIARPLRQALSVRHADQVRSALTIGLTEHDAEPVAQPLAVHQRAATRLHLAVRVRPHRRVDGGLPGGHAGHVAAESRPRHVLRPAGRHRAPRRRHGAVHRALAG